VKYKDLKAVVDVKMRYNLLPIDVRVDFLRASGNTAMVPITIQVANSNLTYVGKDGIQHASVNIYGRLTTLAGQIVNTFEDPVRLDVPAELLPKTINNVSLYQQMLPMRPGRYRLDLVVKDVNSDKLGTLYQSITVPDFSEEFKASTLVLADLVEPVPARDAGSGPFVLGPDKVRPRIPPANGNPVAFKHGEKINLWMQVYNLATDEKTGKPRAAVEYRVINTASGQTVYDRESAEIASDLGNGVTLKEILSKGTLEPGVYQLTVTIHDVVANRVLAPTVKFAVN
jgi:hypothetical protein